MFTESDSRGPRPCSHRRRQLGPERGVGQALLSNQMRRKLVLQTHVIHTITRLHIHYYINSIITRERVLQVLRPKAPFFSPCANSNDTREAVPRAGRRVWRKRGPAQPRSCGSTILLMGGRGGGGGHHATRGRSPRPHTARVGGSSTLRYIHNEQLQTKHSSRLHRRENVKTL